MEIAPGELRVFEPVKQLGSKCGSGHGGGDYSPAEGSGDGIMKPASQCKIDSECNDVGKSFEE